MPAPADLEMAGGLHDPLASGGEAQRTSSSSSQPTTTVGSGYGEGRDEEGKKSLANVYEMSIVSLAEPPGPDAAVDADANAKMAAMHQPSSRASSTPLPALTIVPRSQRRGLFSSLTIVPEVERSYDYKNVTKWGITLTVALATAAGPLGSTIFYPALPGLTKALHIDETTANLSVAMYMLAMAIFPLWWSSFSEQFGRRTIYLVSFFFFVIFAILSAVSVNIGMLVVSRILTGGASASVQAVGAGTIADIWEPRDRGRAMGIFYLGPLLGPFVAPIVGGALAQGFGWRGPMWFLAIYGFVVVNMLLFCLPETLARQKVEEAPPETELRSTMTAARPARMRTKNLAVHAKRSFIDPLRVLLLLRFPPVLITVFICAIAFAAIFMQNITIQQKFARPPYGYSEIVVGLLYVPSGLGYITASFVGGRWSDSIMAREAKKANRLDGNGKLIYLPEDRMRENVWLTSALYPVGLLIFGWTLDRNLIWILPSIGSYIFGLATMVVFSAATTMLTEFVRRKSSAGVAVSNFVRNILSCVGVVAAAPWINAIGVGWVFTTVALFCLLTGCIGLWTLRRNASRWRKVMDEALNKT